VPTAECQVFQDDGNEGVSPPMRVVAKLRGDDLFHLTGKYFADLRFDGLTNSITAEVDCVPNHPWTLVPGTCV
jgi:hypothetical protein